MGSFSFWQKWLLIASILITVFGVFMVVSSFFGGNDSGLDPEFARQHKIITFEAFRQWIYAVLGATIAGWGICLSFMAHYPFKRKELWSWQCLLLGLVVWFVLGIAASLYLKVYFNAILNTILFVLVLLPLVFTRRHFVSSGPIVH